MSPLTTEQSEPGAARAEGIAKNIFKPKNKIAEGFAGPEGEPSAGYSEAQRNPQKPGPQGRALKIFQYKIKIAIGLQMNFKKF